MDNPVIIVENGVEIHSWYNGKGQLHRENDNPALIKFLNILDEGNDQINPNNFLTKEWYIDGKKHRVNGPAVINYRNNGEIYEEYWYIDNKKHREDGPAIIIYKDNKISEEYWYINGIRHRVDGPAYRYFYNNEILGNETWYMNNLRHRLDGPANVSFFKNGKIQNETWYVNNMQHRVDGPFSIMRYENGNIRYLIWKINNKLHNDSGPAVIYFNENGNMVEKEYFLEGKQVTKEFINELLINKLWERENVDNHLQWLPLEMLNITKDLFSIKEEED